MAVAANVEAAPWIWRAISSAAAARPLLLLLLALQLCLLVLLRTFPLSIPFLTSSNSWSLVFPRRLPLTPPSSSSKSSSTSCNGSLIYVYNLPPQFNSHLIQNCSSLSPWEQSMCPALSNDGMGVAIRNPPWPPSHAWYATDQFSAELIFHSRMQRHLCITYDPNLATLFFVPFYAGLAVYRPLFIPEAVKERDELCNELLQWLSAQAPWRKNGGWDHFFAIGRITWDFRRANATGWGSSFFHMPLMQNTTRLLIEKDPEDERDIAIPYPTSFHPSREQDVERWQEYVRSRARSRAFLFSFAGGPRNKFSDDFRQLLLQQCEESRSCKALDCTHGICEYPKSVMELFLDSNFCLQPRGDSFTRRSMFDCLLAGAIPVFFWNQSAYWQYHWYLPSDPSSYSVFIPKDAVRNGSRRGMIEQVLMEISEEKLISMQSRIVDLIPSIVYANTTNSFTRMSDAFDVAIKAVVNRVKSRSSELHS